MTIHSSIFQHKDILLNSHNIILTSNKNNSNFLMSPNSRPYSDYSSCLQNVFIAVLLLNQEPIKDQLLHFIMSTKSLLTVSIFPFPFFFFLKCLSEEIRPIVCRVSHNLDLSDCFPRALIVFPSSVFLLIWKLDLD